MTRGKPTKHEAADMAYACDRCGADAGDWCVSPSGRYLPELHAVRFLTRVAAGIERPS